MDKNKNNDPTMGGLDALVAAASSVAGQTKKARARGGLPLDMIDPALTGDNTGISKDTADALALILSNPSVIQLIAEHNAKKNQQRRHVSLYTQLLSGSAMPSAPPPPDTPVQQTRYGRISRPPVYAPANNIFQQLLNMGFGPGSSNTNASNLYNQNQNSNNNLGSSSNYGSNQASDVQLQAIKDALQNVSQADNDPSNATYDALMQAVDGGDVASRFWRNQNNNADIGSSSSNWTGGGVGLDAQTLAQAAEAQRLGMALGLGMPSGHSNGNGNGNGRKRDVSAMESTEDESVDSGDIDGNRKKEGPLPEWPLPPSGKGGRKNMPRDELLARRRARNRVAAQESRKKKKEFFGTIEDRLKDRDDAFRQTQDYCRRLEQEVEALKKVILGAGLELPSISENKTPGTLASLPMIDTPLGMGETSNLSHTPFTIEDLTPGTGSGSGFDMPFHDLFTIDDNDADDGDFVPPSSPKRDSESEDSDADDEEDPSISATQGRKGKGKGKGKNGRRSTKKDTTTTTEIGKEDETPIEVEGEGEAEDEEEDLFLPIEDVPIPPQEKQVGVGMSIFDEEENKVIRKAMTELHVDTPQELMGVIRKMVDTASYGGVTQEQVGMLSKLLALGQAQGMSVW